MPLSNPVIRRYTPPTCTLKIEDRNSPLSRRLGHSAHSLLQFELHLDDPRLPEEKRFHLQGEQQQFTALQAAVTNYVQSLLNQLPEQFKGLSAIQAPATIEPNLEENAAKAERIYLQPGRGLSHNLFLGSLATSDTGQVIELNTLQLFDLVTALDEYTADVTSAAAAVQTRDTATATPSTAWASIAAVLLVAVGLTIGVVQYLNRSNSTQTTVANRKSPTSGNEQIALQPSPTPLSSPLDALPPLPSVGSSSATPTSNLPPLTVPKTSPPLQAAPPVPSLPTTGVTPNSPAVSTTPTIPVPSNITPGSIAINPIPGPSRSLSIPEPRGTNNSPSTQAPTNTPSPSPQASTSNRAQSTTPSTNSNDTSEAEDSSPAAPSVEERLNAALQRSPTPLTPPNQPQTTAFAATRQVTEAREYFQQRWEPPSTLQQALEYSIVLDVDGTIRRIEPLGQASRTYVDRTPMPYIGDPFVSSNPSGQTPRIRVVLGADGKVQTFLEPD